ncbi:MAG TPA: EthD family reductase [Actinocrinis sp.]|nr:EthD family reductase [Actinocrinis sp.]
MPTKITAIYDNPQDPDAFEAGHGDQIALAKKIPGVQRIESAKVWPKEDGSDTPAYRVLDLYFADYDAASEAVTTVEAGAFVGKVFELSTGGVKLLFSDVEEV